MILLVIGLFMVYPMVWMLLSSLKTTEEVLGSTMTFLPSNPQWLNFAGALEMAPFLRYIWNSFSTAFIIVLMQLFLSSLLAYSLTQMEFKGRNSLFMVILCTYMLPAAATYVPSYVIISRLGLMDSLSGIVVSNLVNVFTIFLLRQNFLKVPRELIEAARADGSSDWTILWRIVVPMSKNAIINASILSFIGNFNNYLWPSLITNSQENYLISVGLNRFFNSQGAFRDTFPLIMAATVISVLPLLLVYFLLQKYFIGAVSSSAGVKG
ncbi:carbohydrate ABC transporter permease [Robertmurraya massiliosenegalensis]|uniref:carbohydrate ABC transporter permease n=1 Tax=Robertmurraya massiliosenegalensis TaxID=1287657 RepID=UPI001BC8A9E0|nr:carbohydrate ABC transporter permease [Robertmurraya massiliosenegalensis]